MRSLEFHEEAAPTPQPQRAEWCVIHQWETQRGCHHVSSVTLIMYQDDQICGLLGK